jgi:hypothetical protein
MDDFRRHNMDYITAMDLDCKYVSYRHETRREFMKIANRLARRNLKQELRGELEDIERKLL